MSAYDPYYHLAQAYSYWSGKNLNLPIISTMTTMGSGDLYLLYHFALAPFTAFFNGENFNALITGSKIFQSFLIGFLFVTFYWVLNKLLLLSKKIEKQKAVIYSLLGSVFLFSIFPEFTARMFMLRPQIISTIFIILAFYFILQKKWKHLFIISFIFPFFYSISFMILVPAIIYVLSDIIYHRKKIFNLKLYKPVIVPALGLLTGIIALPNSYYYFLNAYYIHLKTVINKYFIKEGSEMYSPVINFIDWVWFIPLALLLAYYLLKKISEEKTLKEVISFNRFYLMFLTFSMFLVYTEIQRALEYFVPFLIILFSIILFEDLLPYCKKIIKNRSTKKIQIKNPSLKAINDTILIFLKSKILKIFLISTILIYFIGTSLNITQIIARTPDYKSYQKAAQFMKDNSKEGDLVFNPKFSSYPRLVLLNNYNRYTYGMGMSFAYEKDPELFFRLLHLSQNEQICPKRKCSEKDTSEDPYNVLKNLDVKFIFIQNTSDFNKNFLELLDNNSDFQKVFNNPKYPQIFIYTLKNNN
jgi:hypothetical protein